MATSPSTGYCIKDSMMKEIKISCRKFGKQLASEIAIKEFLIKNPGAKIYIPKPEDKSEEMAPYFNEDEYKEE